MLRRKFLKSGLITSAFLGMSQHLGQSKPESVCPYGKLVPDPEGLLNLPKGFSYQVISRLGNRMSDGYKVPGQFDGMAAFQSRENPDHLVLVRNHEIGIQFLHLGPFDNNAFLPSEIDRSLSYDPGRIGFPQFVGGTTNIVYNTKTKQVEKEFLSLLGTDRNCAGGVTPRETWITCEEPIDTQSELGVHHGYCFEVSPTEQMGLQKPEPITAMGRFRHEAIAVDPQSHYVYLTEDRHEGALYRFRPIDPHNYHRGGVLEALVVKEHRTFDTRNWQAPLMSLQKPYAYDWVELTEPESPKDDLRFQAADKGGAIFARAEGCWCDGDKIWFACTNGGPTKQAQLFYLNTKQQTLHLFLQPEGDDLLTNADNLTVAPNSDVFICEDRASGAGPSKLQVVSAKGACYTLAENALNSSELAGACFSPDGRTLFLNIQTPGYTVAINGPWPWLG